MIQYLPIILICASTISVDDCHKDNKDVTDVIVGEAQNTPMMCLVDGTTKAAATQLSKDNKYYVKIKCIPKESNG